MRRMQHKGRGEVDIPEVLYFLKRSSNFLSSGIENSLNSVRALWKERASVVVIFCVVGDEIAFTEVLTDTLPVRVGPLETFTGPPKK